MKTWLTNLWDAVRTSFWFVPSLMILGAIAAGVVLPDVDARYGDRLPAWTESTSDTARAMLGALTSAMLTTAGIVFSVTVVTLSITSSQFGPRLLRSFMSRATAQATLGFCIGTSVYCLMLMRVVDKWQGEIFVPNLSILAAMVMATTTLCVVVFFLHDVAKSIQPNHIAAVVAADLDESIGRLFPERIGGGPPDEQREATAEELEQLNDAADVLSEKEGYVVAIDSDRLLACAVKRDVLLELRVRPGDFVAHDALLARAAPASRTSSEVHADLQAAVLIDNRRTPRQDVECAVLELVEVAVRALSPGINSPLSAVVCIDRLGAALARLADRRIPSSLCYDQERRLRIVARPYMFDGVLSAAFDQIRQYGASSVAVTIRLLEALTHVAQSAHRSGDRAAIHRQADMILAAARRQEFVDGDLRDVEHRYGRLIAAIEAEAPR